MLAGPVQGKGQAVDIQQKRRVASRVQDILGTMYGVELLGRYFLWHYTKGVADVAGVSLNALWFLYHFFSLPSLLSTLFSPFERIEERFSRGFDIEDFLSVILVNILMRFVGFVMRSILIAVGIIVILGVLVLSVVFFILWFFLPLVVGGLLFGGVTLFMPA
jgi:hypothetical protein